MHTFKDNECGWRSKLQNQQIKLDIHRQVFENLFGFGVLANVSTKGCTQAPLILLQAITPNLNKVCQDRRINQEFTH